MEPGEIVRQAREKEGWSQAKLAKLIGISQPAIKKIESGDTQNSKFLPRLAQVLSLDLSDLVPSLKNGSQNGAGDPPRGASIVPVAQLMGARDFPVYASAEGGPGQIVISTDAVDWVPRPAPLLHVRGSYGLLVTGASMEPEYRPGDTALVNPHLPIVGGEVYIFYAEREGSARATIKHLRRQAHDSWHVSQWNPPDDVKQDFTLSRKEWQWAHRVLGKYSRQ